MRCRLRPVPGGAEGEFSQVRLILLPAACHARGHLTRLPQELLQLTNDQPSWQWHYSLDKDSGYIALSLLE